MPLIIVPGWSPQGMVHSWVLPDVGPDVGPSDVQVGMAARAGTSESVVLRIALADGLRAMVPWILQKYPGIFWEKKRWGGGWYELCHIIYTLVYIFEFEIPKSVKCWMLHISTHSAKKLSSFAVAFHKLSSISRRRFWVPKSVVIWVPMWVWHGSSGAPICRRCPSCPAFWRTSNRLLAGKTRKKMESWLANDFKFLFWAKKRYTFTPNLATSLIQHHSNS